MTSFRCALSTVKFSWRWVSLRCQQIILSKGLMVSLSLSLQCLLFSSQFICPSSNTDFLKCIIFCRYSDFWTIKYLIFFSSFWNFDALFQPQQHPARDAHDTFFLSGVFLAHAFFFDEMILSPSSTTKPFSLPFLSLPLSHSLLYLRYSQNQMVLGYTRTVIILSTMNDIVINSLVEIR